MEGGHDLQAVGFLLRDDRLAPVPEQMAHPAMVAVAGPGIAGEERAHGPGERARAGPEQEVGVIRQGRAGVDGPRAGRDQSVQPAEDVGPFAVAAEDRPPVEPPHHDIVEDPGRIKPRAPRHGGRLPQRD